MLGVLWSAAEPLTAAEVRAGLPGAAAYTTVLTALSRLHAKGLLVRSERGRASAYTPVADEAAHTAGRMRALLERGSDRAAVLRRFVTDLSAEDEQLLHDLLSGAAADVPGATAADAAGAGAGTGPGPRRRG